jgi:ABC-type multidrug transport system ATPase subunit
VSSAETSLRLEHVGVDLGGRAVLDDVNLVLNGGEAVGLTGPSGSGKTVLCLVLAGALEPTRGTLRLEVRGGHAVPLAPASGLVLQVHGLVEGLSAEENAALLLQARGVPRAEVARRVGQALCDVDLSRHAGRPVEELSGGERQRVGIARALAVDPLVLVADEPTAELDSGNRARVLRLLDARAREGAIVVIASDDPEVLGACGQVLVLDRGRLRVPPSARTVTG